jgi:hypothetical protein
VVDHNPGGGHLLGAGLSPQVASISLRVYSIYAITTFAFLRYAITIRLFGNIPLQFDVCLRCAILYVFDTLRSVFDSFAM